mgnify:CR=1 FL=1
MSEVYLTKIERKTIFTKSLIFVLIMFIISDLTHTTPQNARGRMRKTTI